MLKVSEERVFRHGNGEIEMIIADIVAVASNFFFLYNHFRASGLIK